MHALMYLVAFVIALSGIGGALYWFFEMMNQMAVVILIAGLLSAAIFWALGFIISQLYDVNRKLDKAMADQKVAREGS